MRKCSFGHVHQANFDQLVHLYSLMIIHVSTAQLQIPGIPDMNKLSRDECSDRANAQAG